MSHTRSASVPEARSIIDPAVVDGCLTSGNRVDERVLVAQAKSGCSGAFGELYERHRSQIYLTALRILHNQQDAEDAVQRSFQLAFTKLARFRGESAFSTWMTRIAINEALMQLRQRRAFISLSDSDNEQAHSVLQLPDDGLTPEQALTENERREAVGQAISFLRHNLRVVVLLRELQGLTSAETARRLGLTVPAVKARAFHAKRHLKRRLERKFKPRAIAA